MVDAWQDTFSLSSAKSSFLSVCVLPQDHTYQNKKENLSGGEGSKIMGASHTSIFIHEILSSPTPSPPGSSYIDSDFTTGLDGSPQSSLGGRSWDETNGGLVMLVRCKKCGEYHRIKPSDWTRYGTGRKIEDYLCKKCGKRHSCKPDTRMQRRLKEWAEMRAFWLHGEVE